MSRIEELEGAAQHDLRDFYLAPAPHLKRLIVHEDYNGPLEEDLEPYLDLLRGDQASMIQYLDFWGSTVHWLNDAYHPNLTEFHLDGWDEFESIGPVLAALAGMPLLQIFHFLGELPDDLIPSHRKSNIVTLPHLHTVKLGKSHAHKGFLAFSFLSYLDLPSVKSIWIITGSLEFHGLPSAGIRSYCKFRRASLVISQAPGLITLHKMVDDSFVRKQHQLRCV